MDSKIKREFGEFSFYIQDHNFIIMHGAACFTFIPTILIWGYIYKQLCQRRPLPSQPFINNTPHNNNVISYMPFKSSHRP